MGVTSGRGSKRSDSTRGRRLTGCLEEIGKGFTEVKPYEMCQSHQVPLRICVEALQMWGTTTNYGKPFAVTSDSPRRCVTFDCPLSNIP